MSEPLVITGMHRSGTSLVASIMSSMGVFLGSNLIGPGPDNLRGYFEDNDFVAPNKWFLSRRFAELGNGGSTGHHDWGWSTNGLCPPTTNDFDEIDKVILPIIASKRELGIPWGWKDPRNIVMADYYEEACPGSTWVVAYREPWEVARSLRNLHGIPRNPFVENRSWPLDAYEAHNRKVLEINQDRTIIVHANRMSTMDGMILLRNLVEDKAGILLGDPEHKFSKDMMGKASLEETREAKEHPCWDVYKSMELVADLPSLRKNDV